ncbi:cytochrome P450 [Saccharothrix sp. NRRL B-16348]|uniref:cytochrome P450 n=1 Tax=Saccharothrix sp. NRRL B-16348 TaxID=1415542 RepID=UPI0006AF378C|nr:cytochrome P450 [Saccharothrix sp. NRRL B-16348]
MTQTTPPRPAPDVLTYDPETAARMLPFDVFDEQFHQDPYPHYRRLLTEHGGLMRTSADSLAVFGFDEVSAVMKDLRFGIGPGKKSMISDQFVENQKDGESGRILMFMDPPDHTRIRGLVNKAFTPRTLDALRPHALGFAQNLLRKAAGSDDREVDLMAAFARPLPALVLSHLLDIPERYHPIFFASAKESGRGLDPGFTLTEEQKAGRDFARDMFINAGIEMAEARRSNLGDDLISDLVRAEQEGERLTEWELAMLLMNLLAAGFGATTAMIGNAVHNLLEHPDQLAWLRANPDRIAEAVEELLRFDTTLQITTRMALQDADILGRPVAEGTHVIVMLGAANRDPRTYDRPDVLDLSRPMGRNLGFGHGIHFCVAAPIAKMIAQVGLTALLEYSFERGDQELERWPGTFLRVIGALPVKLC